MNAQKIVFLVAYFLAMVLVCASTEELYSSGKRARDRPYLTAMRFGRSGRGTRSGGKHVIVAPRNGKANYLQGIRYGKRSSESRSPPSPIDYPEQQPLCGTDDDLSCTYTGVSNIYRCMQSVDKDGIQSNSLLSSV